MSIGEVAGLKAELAETRRELAEIREAFERVGIGRRRLLSTALVGLGAATVAGVSAPASASADANGVGTFDTLQVGNNDNTDHVYVAVFTFNGNGGTITGDESSFVGGDGGTHDALAITTVAPASGLTVTQRPGSVAYTQAPTGAGIGISSDVGYDSTAIAGSSDIGSALAATTTGASAVHDTVISTQAGLGRAVLATITNPANSNASIGAATKGTGAALYGVQSSPTATGAAVVGTAGAKGRGGKFSGGASSVTLVPSTGATHPPSGAPGDLYVDSTKRLWFCKGATTWKQLA